SVKNQFGLGGRVGVECAWTRLTYDENTSQISRNSLLMNLPASNVLLVEDDPHMPELLSALLEDDNITLISAPSAPEALNTLRERRFDLILLDLGLPGMDGFEFLRQIKALPETQAIPVIVLTAWNGTNEKLRGFDLGAVDYLTKPFESAELRARVCSALRTKRLQDE